MTPDSVPVRFHGSGARALRRAWGVGLAEMARDLDVSPGWIKKIEAGRGAPSVELIARYARRLHVTPDALTYPFRTEEAA